MGVFDTLNSVGGALVPSDRRYAEQRFTAPTGTRIRAARLQRDIGNRDEYWQNYGQVDGTLLPGETCVRPQGLPFCRLTGVREFTGLDAQTLRYGIRCDTVWNSCSNGSTLHMVWATILSASVTLDDTQPPTTGTPTGGLADGAWHRGAGTLSFSASDNTGVRVRRLVEGSTVRATRTAPGAADGGCGDLNTGDAYTYALPCDGSRGLNGTQTVTVPDVCAWGDGDHAIRGSAIDTGGTETVSAGSVTVRVDCTAPTVTVGPSSDQVIAAGQTVAPTVAAVDSRSGVASTETQVQAGYGAPWTAYVGPIPTAADTSYRFRARATDVLGTTSGWAVSSWTTAREPRSTTETTPPAAPPAVPPSVPPAPATPPPVLPSVVDPPLDPLPAAKLSLRSVRRRGRVLQVAGRLTGAAARAGTEVTVTVRVRGEGRPTVRTVRRTVTTAADGTFAARFTLARNAARADRVTAAASGPGGRALSARRTLSTTRR